MFDVKAKKILQIKIFFKNVRKNFLNDIDIKCRF